MENATSVTSGRAFDSARTPSSLFHLFSRSLSNLTSRSTHIDPRLRANQNKLLTLRYYYTTWPLLAGGLEPVCWATWTIIEYKSIWETINKSVERRVFKFWIVFETRSRLVRIKSGQGECFSEIGLLDLWGTKSSHQLPEEMTHDDYTPKLTLATQSKLNLDRGRKWEKEECSFFTEAPKKCLTPEDQPRLATKRWDGHILWP